LPADEDAGKTPVGVPVASVALIDSLLLRFRRPPPDLGEVRVPKAAEPGTSERRAALYRVRAITRRWISFVPS
jgi:hypothetical protein